MDKNFERLITQINSIKETEHNIQQMDNIIKNYTDYLSRYVAVVRNTDSNSISYMNLASLFLLFNRPVFFEMIVKETPQLLWQRTFNSSSLGPVSIVTPIETVITMRDPLKLALITRLPEFSRFKMENPGAYQSLISYCIKRVYQIYELPATKNDKSVIDQLHECEKISPK